MPVRSLHQSWVYEAEPLSIVVTTAVRLFRPTVNITGAVAAVRRNGHGYRWCHYRITVTNPGSGYTSRANHQIHGCQWLRAMALAAVGTEVKNGSCRGGNPTWPAVWPTDGREGGVPDRLRQDRTLSRLVPKAVSCPHLW